MEHSRVLIVVWDGLRPDSVSEQDTPFLWSCVARGTYFLESRVTFPSETRVSSSSFITASYPDKHGIVGNSVYVPEVDREGMLNTASRANLLRIAAARGGEIFPVPTFGQVLAQSGRKLVVVSTATAGSASLVGWGSHATCNREFAFPPSVWDEVQHGLGPMPATKLPTDRLNRHFGEIAVSAWEKLSPDAMVVWLCEPDTAQHRHGVGSPEALAALRNNDRVLERIVGAVGERTHVFVLSDHGHSAQRAATVDVNRRVGEAVRGRARWILGNQAVYFQEEPSEHIVEDVVRALQEMPEISHIFTKRLVPGTLPLTAVRLDAPGSPDIQFSYAWSLLAREGSASFTYTGSRSQDASGHGSLNPTDMHNFKLAMGPSLKAGWQSATPCGLIDVVPTALELLGVARPSVWDGRVLREAFVGEPDTLPSDRYELRSEARYGSSLVVQEVRHARVAETMYLDAAAFERSGV